MCTGRKALVRPVIAAAAASGSRLSVRASMSANTGRARSYSIALAEATNENGDVITSSPSETPTARRARCRPAVPDETAEACRAPRRSAKAASNAGTCGPRESWPERSTPSTAASSSGPMTGRARGTASSADRVMSPRRHGRRRARARPSRRSPGAAEPDRAPARVVHAARQHAGLERVHEGVPARLDDVLADADRAPGVRAVGGVEEHPGHRRGGLLLIEDADLVVDELDVGEVGIGLRDGRTERGVERVHRAVALRGAHVALAVDPDLDRGLGLHAAVLALLGDHPPRLEPEQRLVVARLAPDQQIEGAVRRLEVEAAVLERLDALDHAGGGRVVELDARGLRALQHGAPAAELGDEDLARVADGGRVDVL